MTCRDPAGHCTQVMCEISGCPWPCCGHVHSEQAGGYCSDCPDMKTKREGGMDARQINDPVMRQRFEDDSERATTREFWAGREGNDYHQRQTVTLESNTALFGRILTMTDGVRSIAELGAGTGLNLKAIKELNKRYLVGYDFELCGVEINPDAVREILAIGGGVIGVESAVQDWRPVRKFDLTFTKGLLIHIPPEELSDVYETLVNASSKYVCVIEYFNPTPVEVDYRGQAGRLWKRDFAGELMDRHHLKLVDYGFVWKRDPHAQDNVTWFLLEKP